MQRPPKWGSRVLGLLPVFAVLLLAADPAWKTKPAPAWTEEDARQILKASPWSKVVRAGIARRESEDERRAGGNMGQPTGPGYDGVDEQRQRHKLPTSLLTGPGYTPPPEQFLNVQVRWESALPIRLAELKSQVLEPPTLEGEGYQVAVYGVPGSYFKGDPLTLGEPLKRLAKLKRDGKPDVLPIRAEVFPRPEGTVVVYLFPLSAEINKKDMTVDFEAAIGRIIVSQTFDVQEMQFQGKLEM